MLAVATGRPDMITQAIERLYDVFARYEPNTLQSSCPCCVDRKDVELLLSEPLRKIPPSLFSRYCHKAMTTFGTVQDYKHFLPRICELVAAGELENDPEIALAGKLEYAEFANWPQEEREAIESYLRVLWEDVLHTWRHPLNAGIALCCLTRILGSPADTLETWAALLPTNRTARLHLAEWLTYGPGCDDRPPPFWEESPGGWAKVAMWIKSPAVAEVMQAAYDEWTQWQNEESA